MKKVWMFAVVCALLATTILAQEPQPGQEVDVPGWILTIIGWFSQKWVVGFSAALAATLIPILQGIKMFLPNFEGKLKPAIYWGILFLLGTAISACTYAADGTIQDQEWLPIITGLASSIAAFLGYKLVFSTKALNRINNK